MVGLLFQNHKVKYYLLGFVLFRSSTCRVLSNTEQGCWSHVWFSHVQLHWGCNKIIHSSIIIWYLCFVLKFSFFLEKENNWKAVLPKKKTNKNKTKQTNKPNPKCYFVLYKTMWYFFRVMVRANNYNKTNRLSVCHLVSFFGLHKNTLKM